jgi:hypothetical protein
MKVANRRAASHRVSYELFHGPIPTGLFVLHACDTPACVNPAHLTVGDHAENMRQRSARGRDPIPTGPKITAEQAADIFRRVLAGETTASLAREYGVSKPQVAHIKHGRTWKRIHLNTPATGLNL